MKKKEWQERKKETERHVAKMMTLPFIKDIKEGRKKKRTFWHVEPTGNYFEDCNTGTKYAALALAFMREEGFTPLLTWCVLEMPREDDRSGIEVGFLHFMARAAMISCVDPPALYARHQKELEEARRLLREDGHTQLQG